MTEPALQKLILDYHDTEFFRKLPPRKWQIRGLIATGEVSMFSATPGSGKTFFGIGAAHEISRKTGRPVVFLAGEGRRSIYKRSEAWCRAHSARPDVRWFTGAVNFFTGDNVEALISDLKIIQPAALFIDAFADFMVGADENSTGDAAVTFLSLMRIADEVGCSVVILHHTGHKDQNRGRGSSVFLAKPDILFVGEMRKEGEDLLLSFQITKDRDGEKDAFSHLLYQVPSPVPGDEQPTTLVFGPRYSVLDKPLSTILSPADKAHIVLHSFGKRGAAFKEWQDAISKAHGKKGWSRANLERAITELKERGRIATPGGGGRSGLYHSLAEPSQQFPHQSPHSLTPKGGEGIEGTENCHQPPSNHPQTQMREPELVYQGIDPKLQELLTKPMKDIVSPGSAEEARRKALDVLARVSRNGGTKK